MENRLITREEVRFLNMLQDNNDDVAYAETKRIASEWYNYKNRRTDEEKVAKLRKFVYAIM